MKNCRLELVALELDTTLDVPPRLLRLDAELPEGVGGMRFVAASLRCGSSVTAAAASNFGDDRSSEQSRVISQTRVGGPGLTRAGGAGLKMAEDARRDDRRRPRALTSWRLVRRRRVCRMRSDMLACVSAADCTLTIL